MKCTENKEMVKKKVVKKEHIRKPKQPLIYRIEESFTEMKKYIQSREDVDNKRKELRR